MELKDLKNNVSPPNFKDIYDNIELFIEMHDLDEESSNREIKEAFANEFEVNEDFVLNYEDSDGLFKDLSHNYYHTFYGLTLKGFNEYCKQRPQYDNFYRELNKIYDLLDDYFN